MDWLNQNILLINQFSSTFITYMWNMLLQSSILIGVIFLIDLVLCRTTRAIVRYFVWLLVLVKLILPVHITSPISIGHWLGDALQHPTVESPAYFDTKDPGNSISPQALHTSTTAATLNHAERILNEPLIENISQVASISLSWQSIIFITWVFGIVTLLILLVNRAKHINTLICQSQLADDSWQSLLDQCCQTLKLTPQRIKIRISSKLSSPAVCGLHNPTILLPLPLLNKLSREQKVAILTHELLHIKRYDLPINFLQTLIQIVYFFHPLVWISNAILRNIREQAVDEGVQVVLGDQAPTYRNTLIEIAEMNLASPALSLRLMGVAESKKALAQRIKHMTHRPIPKSMKLGIAGAVTIMLAAIVLLPMAKAETLNSMEEKLVGTWRGSSFLTEYYHHFLSNHTWVYASNVNQIRKGTWQLEDGTLTITNHQPENGENKIYTGFISNIDDNKLQFSDTKDHSINKTWSRVSKPDTFIFKNPQRPGFNPFKPSKGQIFTLRQIVGAAGTSIDVHSKFNLIRLGYYDPEAGFIPPLAIHNEKIKKYDSLSILPGDRIYQFENVIVQQSDSSSTTENSKSKIEQESENEFLFTSSADIPAASLAKVTPVTYHQQTTNDHWKIRSLLNELNTWQTKRTEYINEQIRYQYSYKGNIEYYTKELESKKKELKQLNKLPASVNIIDVEILNDEIEHLQNELDNQIKGYKMTIIDVQGNDYLSGIDSEIKKITIKLNQTSELADQTEELKQTQQRLESELVELELKINKLSAISRNNPQGFKFERIAKPSYEISDHLQPRLSLTLKYRVDISQQNNVDFIERELKSAQTLLLSTAFLNKVLGQKELQQTQWYKNNQNPILDIRSHFIAHHLDQSNLIELVLVDIEEEDAKVIMNHIVSIFHHSQIDETFKRNQTEIESLHKREAVIQPRLEMNKLEQRKIQQELNDI